MLLVLLFSTSGVFINAIRVVPWRETKDYPRDQSHFQLYITKETVPLTGESALLDGCGRNGRPYKHRGEQYMPLLQNFLRDREEEFWVGGMVTTTPWIWTGTDPELYLYRLQGLVPSDSVHTNVTRISANNVFLCSQHCKDTPYILLRNYWCTCSSKTPAVLPMQGESLRCPGTYEEICGTSSAFSVYKSLLSDWIKWGRLTEKEKYYGHNAYLHQSPVNDGVVELQTELDWNVKKGYICNGSLTREQIFAGETHPPHVQVIDAPNALETWPGALNACKRRSKQLLVILPEDASSCVAELKILLKSGYGYWTSLSRHNVSLWLDGTVMDKSAEYHHARGQPACLAIALKNGQPVFTFESCTRVRLQVLCEKEDVSFCGLFLLRKKYKKNVRVLPALTNTGLHLKTFTHDVEGNHIVTRTSASENSPYSDTVTALGAVLVVLCLLTLALGGILWQRNRCIPPKPKSERPRHIQRQPLKASALSNNVGNDKSPDTVKKDDERQKMDLPLSLISCDHDACGYTIVNKDKLIYPLSVRNDNTCTTVTASKAIEYTEVFVSNDLSHGDQNVSCFPSNVKDYKPEPRRGSFGIESEDTYSVLNYRHAIQLAWTGLKQTAYAHVILPKPQKDDGAEAESSLQQAAINETYDIAQTAFHYTPCINNVYDRAEIQKEAEPIQKSQYTTCIN